MLEARGLSLPLRRKRVCLVASSCVHACLRVAAADCNVLLGGGGSGCRRAYVAAAGDGALWRQLQQLGRSWG